MDIIIENIVSIFLKTSLNWLISRSVTFLHNIKSSQKLLHSVYMARKCHSTVAKIDSALSSFDYKLLCNLAQVEDYKNLIDEIV